jgi:Cu/Ag efflux protein CusF
MKKILTACAMASIAFIVGSGAYGEGVAQAAAREQEARRPAQNRAVGVVTAVDAATGQVTIRTDEGASVQVITDTKTSVYRVPPGETDQSKAVRVALTDIAAGDRLFAGGEVSADGKQIAARQIVLTSAAGLAQRQEREREEQRRRRLVGRVTAVNPQAREITLMVRSREGGEAVTVTAPEGARLLRYAPDSLRPADARPGTFADLRVGDQVRAQGDRSADGKQFTAEEIISGAFQRVGGTVTAVNTATNEVTIRNEQTGKSIVVSFGPKSMLRRISPEMAASFGERRGRRGDRNGAGGGAAAQPQGAGGQEGRQTARTDGAGPRQRGDGSGATGPEGRGGGGGGRPPRGGGRNFQEMLESLPAITVADLKKGDTVLVNGTTTGADQSRVTAVTLMTGEAEFLRRMQGGPNRNDGPTNPGLPGDVLGGGTGNREQP